MARGGRGPSTRGFRGRGRARGRLNSSSRHGFKTSRVQDLEDISEPETESSEPPQSNEEPIDQSVSSDSEDDRDTYHSYASLLQALNSKNRANEPPRKKRRLENRQSNGEKENRAAQEEATIVDEEGNDTTTLADAGLEEVLDTDENLNLLSKGTEYDSDDEDVALKDPFETHYARMEEKALKEAISLVDKKARSTANIVVEDDVRKSVFSYGNNIQPLRAVKGIPSTHLKQRLIEGGARVFKTLQANEKDVASELFSYRDIQYGCRTTDSAQRLRDMTSLHALNHIFKTRDRILKNNAKVSQQDDSDSTDFRDQGFTRPKVLFIVPTKQSCARFVDSIATISEPDQQENRSRFLDTFSSQDDEETWSNKPDDFRELFGGNHEEDFRLGLKFTRKTIKYFSGFYNSDIIFGSALGLMRTITTGGGNNKSKDNDNNDNNSKSKSQDADFLSSVEMVIVDNASAIQMQNWQHLIYIFNHLNLLPKDSHGCDFSRVRNWYLDGQAKYLRQTICFTSHHTPELNSLFTTYTFNIQGRTTYTPTYKGTMLTTIPTLAQNSIPAQTFYRIGVPLSVESDSNMRFTYFTTTILPSILRHSKAKGTLLFVPTYADFTRLRNHFSSSNNISFGSVSEYTSVKETSRARSHFVSQKHSILLYTERAHHFFRYKIRGVRRIVFYGVPENPVFWTEMLGFLALGLGPGPDQDKKELQSSSSKKVVSALFSKWDAIKLGRIVGSERINRLVNDPAGDTFEFV